MAVAFEELEGSPVIDIGNSGTQARRAFRVAWDDWRAFAEQLTGGWQRIAGQFQLIDPMPFPGLTNVVIDRVEIAPLDPANPIGDDILTIAEGLNRYPHAGAKVTAVYKSTGDADTTSGGGTAPTIATGTALTYTADLSAEYLTIPGRSWNWKVTGDPKLPSDVHPGILMPTGSFTLLWQRVASPPWATIRGLRGKVNDAPFYDADAGMVLFLGARARRQFEFMQDASLWTVAYSFAERSQAWGKFFRAETNTWTEIEDGAGNPPYTSGDFAALFQFGT